MKTIKSVVFYILLAIALCIPNVSTFCGNDEQIEDIRTALVKEEIYYTALTTLSAIPVTGATLAFAQITLSSRFAFRLKDIFDEMQSSLDKDHRDYSECSNILDKIIIGTTAIKSTNYLFSLTAMIPGVGLAFLAPRLGTSISAMFLMRERLSFWKNFGCQYATKRDCNLKVN